MPRSVTGPEIERLIQLLAKLPGLGPRSARRAALHLIKKKDQLLVPLAEAMDVAVESVVVCSTCGNIDTSDPCTICADPRRDQRCSSSSRTSPICGRSNGPGAINARYHVLGGVLSPLDGVGPDDLVHRRAGQRVMRGRHRRDHPCRQRHRRGPDHCPLHHRPARRHRRQDLPPRPWRARRRRARLSRRRHAVGGDATAHAVLSRVDTAVCGRLRCGTKGGYALDTAILRDIHRYWFGASAGRFPKDKSEIWFSRSDATDSHIRETFGDAIPEAARERRGTWRACRGRSRSRSSSSSTSSRATSFAVGRGLRLRPQGPRNRRSPRRRRLARYYLDQSGPFSSRPSCTARLSPTRTAA